MLFYRRRSPVELGYMSDSITLKRATNIRDLGLLFEQNMLFASHIVSIVSKAYSMLGFMM